MQYIDDVIKGQKVTVSIAAVCCALLLQHICIINANGQEKYRIPATSMNSHLHLCQPSCDAH